MNREDDHIGERLRRYALDRFLTFAHFPLTALEGPSEAFCRLPDSFIGFLVQNRAQTLEWLDTRLETENSLECASTPEFFRRNMIRFLHAKNQYIVVPDDRIDELEEEYFRFLRSFRNALSSCAGEAELGDGLYLVLAEHKRIIDSFVKELGTVNTSHEFLYREPVCAEYSPEFQIRVLGIDPEGEPEPILDLGCGSEARLVRYFRARGKDVWGMDRTLSGDDSADWLQCPLESGHWGTIVSHMAFSIHFIHHHLRPEGLADAYARRYMDILRSLRPGGSFIYAPGLPFIEELLPNERYRVERRPLDGRMDDSGVRDAGFGYSCRVRRIA